MQVREYTDFILCYDIVMSTNKNICVVTKRGSSFRVEKDLNGY